MVLAEQLLPLEYLHKWIQLAVSKYENESPLKCNRQLQAVWVVEETCVKQRKNITHVGSINTIQSDLIDMM